MQPTLAPPNMNVVELESNPSFSINLSMATAVGNALSNMSHLATPLNASIDGDVIASEPLSLWRMPSIEDAVLIAAMAANVVLILSPLRSALLAAHAQLSAKELMHVLAPTYMLFGQCYFWACYGYYMEQPDLAHLNAFGAIMCIVYLSFIAKGAAHTHAQARTFIALSIAMVLAFSLIVARMPVPCPVFACAAFIFSFFQTMAPMYQAADLLRMTSAASQTSFPFALTASGCVSSLLWAQYAWFMQDYMYLLSNTLNALLGVAQLAVVGSVQQRRKLTHELEDCSRPLMPRVVRKDDVANYGSWVGGNLCRPDGDTQKALGMYANSVTERAMAMSFSKDFDEERPNHGNMIYAPRKGADFQSAFGTVYAGVSDDEGEDIAEPEIEPESGTPKQNQLADWLPLGSAHPAAILVPA